MIRYSGLGDDSIQNFPPGDLNVTIMVETDPEWTRRGDDLCKFLDINVFEAMIGCTKQIKCLDGTTMPLHIKPGVQNGAEYASNGRGFKNVGLHRTGSLIIIINVNIPSITNTELIEKIKIIENEVNNLS